MLLLPTSKMESLLNSKQIQYEKTTSLFSSYSCVENSRCGLHLGGVSGNITSGLWNTYGSRRYFDWGYSNTIRVLSEHI